MSGGSHQWNPRATCALLTPEEVAAVATIAFRGDGGLLEASPSGRGFHPRNRISMREQTINRILFGTWGSEPGEDVIVCRTEETEFEIHCHGGRMATQRILDDLSFGGCEVVPWETYIANRGNPRDTEIAIALSQVATEAGLSVLLKQREAWLNFRKRVLEAGSEIDKVVDLLRKVLDRSEFARHLTEPYQFILIGRPNVGKSSLLNALLGFQRALVHPQPGTTRDLVQGDTAIAGWPVRLTDTAGIRDTDCVIEEEGIDKAIHTVEESDGVLMILDRSVELSDGDRRLLTRFPGALKVLNKSDLPDLIGSEVEGIAVSARSGEGLEYLMQRIEERFMDQSEESEAIPFSPRLRIRLEELLRTGESERNEQWLQQCHGLWEGLE